MCQENIGFKTVYSLRYKKGSRISVAGRKTQKTDKDISNYPLLKSLSLTCGCSSL